MFTMVSTLLIFFITSIFNSNGREKDFQYIIDNGLPNNNQIAPNLNNGFRVLMLRDFYQRMYREERVKIQLYYECLCPDCREFDTTQFKETVLALGSHLDINVYPYGNAQTKENNGDVEFICQHGPPECYGNKLHACAIDYLKNITTAVLYNSCMMDGSGKGSDDAAADMCGHSMGINSEPIKQCANSARGTALLKYYGIESKKANFNYVPYILINGVENSGENFKQDVCKAFKTPPPACNGLLP